MLLDLVSLDVRCASRIMIWWHVSILEVEMTRVNVDYRRVRKMSDYKIVKNWQEEQKFVVQSTASRTFLGFPSPTDFLSNESFLVIRKVSSDSMKTESILIM